MTQSDIINNNFSKAFECIKCSNAYNTGVVLSEEKLFKQISERKHSTFDKSKFTVVGSPTITDDGVASGFTQTSHINVNTIDISTVNSWEFGFKINTGNDITTKQYYFSSKEVYKGFLVGISNSKIKLLIGTTGTSWNIHDGELISVSPNTEYYIRVGFTGNNYYFKYSTDNTTWQTVLSVTSSEKVLSNSLWAIGTVYFNQAQYTRGSIDLKQFSITVDGKEVFSGNKTGINTVKIGGETVEIPYTLSKTGSKIVDVAYRDRVIDLYEQEGQAGYYTIDEPNKNFTLPMGEIYGMIGGSSSTGGSGLELCDIGMALYVDETKGLRRRLNGSIMDITSNYQAFLTRLKEITTLYPSLVCTEEEWQTIKTMSKLGQCGKFVYNYGADGTTVTSIRLPLVININGLVDMANAGLIKNESLPNIKGGVKYDVGTGRDTDYTGAISLIGERNNPIWQGATSVNRERDWDFNASRVSSTYKDNAPVQQEAIQYPYFIQVATGSETENNIINDIELNNPYSLFDSKFSDHELNNLSWLKSEGQWNAKAVYPTAYDELLAEYNNSASSEEIEGSITLKRTPKGYKIALADQEAAIETKYATDGIAWYYILDTANEAFKLPRTKFGFVGLRNIVGNYVSESLPNITGSINGAYNSDNVTGAFRFTNTMHAQSPTNSNLVGGFTFDASRVSSTYQNNAPVQQRATEMYLYFYVGETVQNANLIDAGRIGEQLVNIGGELANIGEELQDRLANCLTKENKSEIVSWGLPDYSAGVKLSTGPFTAPTDGLITISCVGGNFRNLSATINGTTLYSYAQNAYYTAQLYLLLNKGDIVSYTNPSYVFFYPLKGAK